MADAGILPGPANRWLPMSPPENWRRPTSPRSRWQRVSNWPEFRIRIYSSAPAASSASAIFCCGILPTPNSIFPRCCGRNFRRCICRRPSSILPSASAASARLPNRWGPMLRTRVVTGCILGALLLLGLFLLPPLMAVLAFGAVFTIGAWEWAGFGALRSALAKGCYALGVACIFVLGWRWTSDPEHLIILLTAACVWWLIAFSWLILAPTQQRPALALLCGLPVLVPAFLALARMQISAHANRSGPLIVLWLVLMVCAADIGAYFAGRSLGRRKLAPRVSPGKTIEGAIGGMLAVALVAWSGAAIF